MKGGMRQNYNYNLYYFKKITILVLGGKQVKLACWITWKNRLQRAVQLTVVSRKGDAFSQYV